MASCLLEDNKKGAKSYIRVRSYLLISPLGRVVRVPGVRPPHRLPLEPPVLDLDVAAGRFVTRVVEAAHFGAH